MTKHLHHDDPVAVVYWLYDDTCTRPEESGYVGACTNVVRRLADHRRSFGTYKGAVGSPHADFKIKILLTGTLIECDTLERELRPHSKIGWNRYRGGRQAFEKAPQAVLQKKKRRPKSPEHIAKIAAALTGRHPSEETLANMRAAQVKSPEQRAKISASLMGHKRSHESIDSQKATLAKKDRSKSPETRERMRLAALARYQKPGELERLSEVVKKGRAEGKDQSGANNPMFGRFQSEETKDKIRKRIEERGGVSGANNPNFGRGRKRQRLGPGPASGGDDAGAD